MRRLIALFDGTWSQPESNTNVERLRRLIAASDAAGTAQLVNYQIGVGVGHGLKHWLGGAFGVGIAATIRDGYRWLCEQHQPGDEIWLFGFSRGAYSARSLAGMIRKCGLLHPATINDALVKSAYAFYRDEKVKPSDTAAVDWRAAHSLETVIHFVGVWETVGMLGIPDTAAWFPFARARYQFHDTELSRIVQRAYQALALDEHRKVFTPTKWTQTPAMDAAATAIKPGQVDVEQRWFVGAHADVGGGYAHDGAGRAPDPLTDLPLAWLLQKAATAGLACTPFTPMTNADLGTPRNSYAEFMGGLYRLISRPFDRTFGTGIHETVDDSVWRHLHLVADYRSPTLANALSDGTIRAPADIA